MKSPTRAFSGTVVTIINAAGRLCRQGIHPHGRIRVTKAFNTVGPHRIKLSNSLTIKENGDVYLIDSSRRHYQHDVHLEVLTQALAPFQSCHAAVFCLTP
jgi:hypothetical protein